MSETELGSELFTKGLFEEKDLPPAMMALDKVQLKLFGLLELD